MSNRKKAITKREDFRTVRRYRYINRFVQSILVLTFVLGLNYLGAKKYIREDISMNRIYSLSPESVAYLEKLEKPVSIILTIPPESEQQQTAQIYKTIKRLVNEYEYATRNNVEGKITVQFINPFKETQKAQEIAKQYGVHKENAIIIACGEHHRQISGNDLYTFKHGEIEGFRGEQIFTSSILDVTRDDRQKVYFVQGHGEMRINDVDPIKGLTQLTQILETQNLEVASLNLAEVKKIPDDANLIIIASPKMPFLGKEIRNLRKFLDDENGRLIIFLEPDAAHGMEDLFYEWGILVDDMIVLDSGKDFQAAGGDLIIRRFATHPVTQFLVDYELPVLMGLSRPVRPDIGASLDTRRSTVVLATSSESSWGERSYHDFDNIEFNPDRDLPGPVPIATLSERQVDSEIGIKIPGGRIIVVGNSDAISNNRINALGNKILLQNAVNWSLDRNELLNIPVRTLNKYQITMSQNDLMHVAASMFAFPCTLAIFGLFIYTLRRR